jgi:hypothetical protein
MAEKIFGWQWIPAGQYGPHVKEGTNWLLPENGLSGIKSDVSAGWITIAENRLIPRNWIPRYTTSLDDTWQLVERVTQPPQSQEEALLFRSTRFMFWFEKANLWAYTREAAANALCVAALRACGMEVEYGQ